MAEVGPGLADVLAGGEGDNVGDDVGDGVTLLLGEAGVLDGLVLGDVLGRELGACECPPAGGFSSCGGCT